MVAGHCGDLLEPYRALRSVPQYRRVIAIRTRSFGAGPRRAGRRPVFDAGQRFDERAADGTGMIVVANMAAGSGRASDAVAELRVALPAAVIHICDRPGKVDRAMKDAAAQCRSLGVVGGDGTVNAGARAARDIGVPLAVFPAGTRNHFARDLGVGSLDEAVRAARSGRVISIDVGEIGDQIFLNGASIGCYADLVDQRRRLEPRLGRSIAMFVAGLAVLRDNRRIEVRVDEERHRVWIAYFGNGRYDRDGLPPGDRHDLAGGLLDVRVLHATPPIPRLRLVGAVLSAARLPRCSYERHLVRSVEVEIDDRRSMRIAFDGETTDAPSRLVVASSPSSLLVHVP